MQLNLEQTKQKFDDFLAEDGNTDRRNEHCAYFVGGIGGPSCVMAHFFIWLNVDRDTLYALSFIHNNETSIIGNEFLLLPYFDCDALTWLDRIQGYADQGGEYTWKEAAYEANQPPPEDERF